MVRSRHLLEVGLRHGAARDHVDAYAVIAYFRGEPADFAKLTVYRHLASELDIVICG